MILERRAPQESEKGNLEIANALMRMERSYNNILHLKKRLSSYCCEPRTYSLFEQLEELKLQIELLSISHLKLMNDFKTPLHFIEVQKQQVKENIDAVNSIEKDVTDYINLAR